MTIALKGALAVALSVFALGFGSPDSAVADEYAVDTAHSAIVFNISHSNLSNVHGNFNSFSGSFNIDEAAPENSSVSLSIDVNSIDTAVEKRNDHLKSPDFFNAAQFPVITFESTEIEHVGDDMYKVTGDLTMHGVTKSITIDVRHNGFAAGQKGEPRAGFSADFTLLRSDYGISYGLPNVGDEVNISVSFQGMGEAPAAAEAS